ncbi:hypothetical protein [Pseudoduganella violacea]|uniref:Uncharacterized protein n=1 Tax=Pseudoduganella violacea TaxID=1715466 RepID=A0A7W5B929_9BURK|nr:hypothetical protein [Pseudoduganella violacea]MBB3118465.1 hypothetical protein [Pseudoduganella violacea]
MGNSLHNKIYLGRRASPWASKRAQLLIGLGLVAGLSALWLVLRT